MRALVILLALAACGGGSASMRGSAKGGGATKKKENVNAKARLKSAIDADKNLWEAHHDLGVIAFKDGEDDAAVDAFSKALVIKKNYAPSLLGRAEAHRHAGRKREARADYDAVIATTEADEPNHRDAATRLASLLRDAGEYDEAVKVLRETVRVSGSSARVYTELGMIYIQQKRYDLAQLVLQKAGELDAKDPAVFNALALLAMRQGHAQEAFQLFDQAVSLDATYLDARFNKASVLLDAGDYARAKAELVAIVQKRDDDYAAMVALGVAHRGLKEHQEAKRVWDRVIREAPRRSSVRADAMYDMAILKLDFLNDAAGGKADLDRYLQEAPSGHAKRSAAEEKRKELGK